jgi:RecJ-like exonuclease
LTAGRYYEGSVDGYADFGVFVDVGDHVTGLLHQSELDRRLESLEWDRGDTIYVQVLRVRDNGDIDLGWSIRQSERDFRGKLLDDPDADVALAPDENDETDELADGSTDADGRTDEADAAGGGGAAVDDTSGDDSVIDDAGATDNAATDDAGAAAGSPDAGATVAASDGATAAATGEPADAQPDRVPIESLDDRVGDRVTLAAEVIGVRQTGGPTVFELRDETAVADVAAFDGAGVRAYPDVESGDTVRVVGEVEMRHDGLQVESETVSRLTGDDADAVRERLDAALDEQARPDEVEPVADYEPVTTARGRIVDAASEIRRAVFESRPVIVRHTATADGYVAGAAIERAVLPLIRDEHTRSDAEYHYVDRRPLEDSVYGMDDATGDVTSMLEDRERHDEALPLVVVVDAGSTEASLEGYELLSVYDVDHVVIDADEADEAVRDAVSTVVDAEDPFALTTTALAVDVAAAVNGAVRTDLSHLPAVSYWEDAPDVYRELAAQVGYDETTIRELREALALSAYYQTYEDKRQLVVDLLFGEGAPEGDARGLASHVSEQFREKLDAAVETARANAEVREADGSGESGDGPGVRFTVLDAESFADGYEFPPIPLLIDELHRRDGGRAERQVTLAVGTDELHVRSDAGPDLRAVADEVADALPEAGVRSVGGRSGHLGFVAGEREAVLRETVQAVADLL